jgi:hypothetical protein
MEVAGQAAVVFSEVHLSCKSEVEKKSGYYLKIT